MTINFKQLPGEACLELKLNCRPIRTVTRRIVNCITAHAQAKDSCIGEIGEQTERRVMMTICTYNICFSKLAMRVCAVLRMRKGTGGEISENSQLSSSRVRERYGLLSPNWFVSPGQKKEWNKPRGPSDIPFYRGKTAVIRRTNLARLVCSVRSTFPLYN